MKDGTLKTILAALGVFFAVMVLLSFFIALFKGDQLTGSKIAVIEVEGVITSSKEINKSLNYFNDREDIKAIILRINSPGGAVGPSQEVYQEILKIKQTTKIVSSLGTVAASGGYYIASATDKIVSNPGTITGSIGVIIEFMNFKNLFEKVGVSGTVIKSGKFKDTGSPLRDMKEEEKKYIQAVIDDVHGQFVDAVTTSRGLERESVSKIADGRIFSGQQALELGLVDSIGNLADAVDVAKKLVGIEGKHHLVYPEKKVTLLETLTGVSPEQNLKQILGNKDFKIMYLFSGIN